MITRVPGNKFNNGIILGISEALSCFTSVLMLRRLHHKAAFVLCLTLGVVCSIILNCTPFGFWTYCLLLGTLIGISGAINVGIILVELCVNPQVLGAALEMAVCFGISSALGSSIIAQADMPWPIITFIALWVLGLIACYYLPKGGRYLKKVDHVNDTLIRGEIDLYTINMTVLEGCSHSMTYG